MKEVQYYKDALTDRLKELINGRSISEFSKSIGIPERTINFWINKKRMPGMYSLIMLADKCNVSIDYLVGLKDY